MSETVTKRLYVVKEAAPCEWVQVAAVYPVLVVVR